MQDRERLELLKGISNRDTTYAMYLVPVVGYVLLTVWLCERGTRGSNDFGRDPVPDPRASLQGRRDDRLIPD